jgi:hypothetical protein
MGSDGPSTRRSPAGSARRLRPRADVDGPVVLAAHSYGGAVISNVPLEAAAMPVTA